MIRLYNDELSGNCYKLRLFMAVMRLAYERVPVNFFPAREHKSEWFRAINPRGQLPVLDDDGFVLRDAQACLVYLASKYDSAGAWYPSDPATRGRITLWLAVAEELTRTASAARLHDAFRYSDIDVVQCRRAALDLFASIEEDLAVAEIGRSDAWLAAGHATLADIACFPYVALAMEGGLSLDGFPALRRWLLRVRGLPGFVGMPGIFPLGIEPRP